MIINTQDVKSMPGLMSATLSQTGDGASELALAWRGWGPEWLEYMEPVALLHRGRVLFAGRVVAFSRSNSGGEVSTKATVQDALWLTDHQTLGAQVAEIEAENAAGAADLSAAARSALQSWARLAESCVISAPGGWVVGEDGAPDDGGEVHMDTSRANAGAAPTWRKEKGITTYTALLTMQQANPDAFFRYCPTTGAVEVVSVMQAEERTWDTAAMRISEVADVGPQYENKITGIALVITASAEGEDGISAAFSQTFLYPPDIAATDQGVHVITASISEAEQLYAQYAYMMQQIKAYYDATNILMCGGSVTALMEDVAESPLCCRLNLVGPGTHESWHSMAAMVTGVEWDFLAGTVTVSLGTDLQQPNINALEFEAGVEFSSSSEKSSTEDTTTTPRTRSFPGRRTTSSTTTENIWYFPSTTREGSEETTTTKGGNDGGDGGCVCGGITPEQKILNSVFFLEMHNGINATEPCLILQRHPSLYVDGLFERTANSPNIVVDGYLCIEEYEQKLKAGEIE